MLGNIDDQENKDDLIENISVKSDDKGGDMDTDMAKIGNDVNEEKQVIESKIN